MQQLRVEPIHINFRENSVLRQLYDYTACTSYHKADIICF